MASIRDVAKEAGVSPATVSRTFTTPNLINLQTQQRVLAAARSLDYRPPRLRNPRSGPQITRQQRSVKPALDAIGFQFFTATPSPDDTLATNGFYMPVLFGAQSEAAALGLHLLVHTTDRHAMSLETPRMIQEQAVGGLLLVGTADPGILRSLAGHVPNIVLVDNHDETETHECVVSDGFSGAMAATRYLLSLGHRRIGFFLPELGVMTFQDRLRGYRCAMIEADIYPTPDLVFGVGATWNDTARPDLVAMLLRSQQTRPSAVLCANDDTALLLMRICRELDIRIPEDLSIVGFDDVPFAVNMEPPLTTVRVDKELLGRLAVRRLHDRFKNASGSAWTDQPPIRHVAPVSLIVRHSCCPTS